MDNQIEKFDPSKLMDGVRDRIKSTFVSLIPDDVWDKMVEKEIYVFTTGSISVRQETHYDQTDENGNYIVKTIEERTPYSQRTIEDSWGHKKYDDISPLQKMIREELQNKFREDLKTYLASEDYQGIYDSYGAVQVGKAIEEVLIRNTDTIFKNFMASVMQRAFDSMRSSIGQSY